jgi:hypothetical protein
MRVSLTIKNRLVHFLENFTTLLPPGRGADLNFEETIPILQITTPLYGKAVSIATMGVIGKAQGEKGVLSMPVVPNIRSKLSVVGCQLPVVRYN